MLLERKAQRQRIWAECMDKIAAVRPGPGSRGDFRAQRQGGEWLNERGGGGRECRVGAPGRR
jgi:hypothetical protein